MTAKLWSEVGPLRAEVRRLRDETGQLTTDDPNLAYAIRIPTADGAPRQYRVYLPSGRRYAFCYQQHSIPESGLPEHTTHRDTIAAGEWVATIKLDQARDPATGELTPYAHMRFKITRVDEPHSSHRYSLTVGEQDNIWISGETGFGYGLKGVGRELEKFDPSEPIVLFRARAARRVVVGRHADGSPRRWTSEAYEGECDGVMIWLEPDP